MTLYAENLREGQENQYILKTRTHNLETLASIYKKNATLLEASLLRNCGKLSSLSRKNWRDFVQKKVATKKHRFAASKEALLDTVDIATN